VLDITFEHRQIDLERPQLLAEVVVQLTRQGAPLLFLDRQQPLRKLPQALVALCQVEFGALAVGDVLRSVMSIRLSKIRVSPFFRILAVEQSAVKSLSTSSMRSRVWYSMPTWGCAVSIVSWMERRSVQFRQAGPKPQPRASSSAWTQPSRSQARFDKLIGLSGQPVRERKKAFASTTLWSGSN